MGKRLPVRLGKEPIIDAVCEVRFKANAPAADLLPGILFSELQHEGQVLTQPLPVAGVPAELRKAHPQAFTYAAVVRLALPQYYVSIGDRSVTVHCRLPYVGWKVFGAFVSRVFGYVLKTSFVTEVERMSVKYVNLLQSAPQMESSRMIDWSVCVGPYRDGELNSVSLAFERRHSPNVATLTQLIGDATAQLEAGSKNGSIVDVDTIAIINSSRVEDFRENLQSRLDSIRLENKIVFFDCLRDEAIDLLEPQYE